MAAGPERLILLFVAYCAFCISREGWMGMSKNVLCATIAALRGHVRARRQAGSVCIEWLERRPPAIVS
jgi:hypothetical protein